MNKCARTCKSMIAHSSAREGHNCIAARAYLRLADVAKQRSCDVDNIDTYLDLCLDCNARVSAPKLQREVSLLTAWSKQL